MLGASVAVLSSLGTAMDAESSIFFHCERGTRSSMLDAEVAGLSRAPGASCGPRQRWPAGSGAGSSCPGCLGLAFGTYQQENRSSTDELKSGSLSWSALGRRAWLRWGGGPRHE
eukprot:scaffold8552_cov267-Pinguiococcus_pyrenoidosus.AAC.2